MACSTFYGSSPPSIPPLLSSSARSPARPTHEYLLHHQLLSLPIDNNSQQLLTHIHGKLLFSTDSAGGEEEKLVSSVDIDDGDEVDTVFSRGFACPFFFLLLLLVTFLTIILSLETTPPAAATEEKEEEEEGGWEWEDLRSEDITWKGFDRDSMIDHQIQMTRQHRSDTFERHHSVCSSLSGAQRKQVFAVAVVSTTTITTATTAATTATPVVGVDSGLILSQR